MPVYNGAKYLNEAIDSILNQNTKIIGERKNVETMEF
jgi:glycosyltransferase involved in cell wall biosynthesis